MPDQHPMADYVSLKEWANLRDDVFGLKKDYGALASSVGELAVGVRALAAKFDESRKPNWVIVIAILGLVFGILPVMGGGSLWIISGQISQTAGPINAKIAQLESAASDQVSKLLDLSRMSNDLAKEQSILIQEVTANSGDIRRSSDLLSHLGESAAASAVADGVSRSDRVQLNDRIRLLEGEYANAVSERKGQVAEIEARLAEVEQQFHAMNNVSNLRWSEQLRTNAITYEKIHPGERYPAEGFFPSDTPQGGAVHHSTN